MTDIAGHQNQILPNIYCTGFHATIAQFCSDGHGISISTPVGVEVSQCLIKSFGIGIGVFGHRCEDRGLDEWLCGGDEPGAVGGVVEAGEEGFAHACVILI